MEILERSLSYPHRVSSQALCRNSHPFWGLLINLLGIADGAAAMLPLQLSNPSVSCFPFSRANRGWEGQNVAVREEGRWGTGLGWEAQEGIRFFPGD